MGRTWTYRRAFVLTCGLVLMILMAVVWIVDGGRLVRWPIWGWVLVIGLSLIGLAACVMSAVAGDARMENWVGAFGTEGGAVEAIGLLVIAAPVYVLGLFLADMWDVLRRRNRA